MTNIHKAAREALPHFEEALDSALEQLQEATIKYAGYKQDKITAMEREYQAGRAALATLRAALSEAPGEERDERAAFEDWIAPTLRNGSHLNRSRVNQVYTDNRVAAKWAAWQARAMLAARPEAQKGEPAAWLCEYRSGEEFVSLAKDPMRDPDVMSAVPLYLAARPEVPQGEPVAWIRHDWDGTGARELTFDPPESPPPVRDEVVRPIWTPLYARPSAPTVALTEEQMPAPWPIRAATRIGHISELHDYAHRAIAKFCEVNGLAQPNEAGKEGGA